MAYGWSPASLPNLKFWWRADQTPALSTSKNITQLDDQSGNGNHGAWDTDQTRRVANVTGGLSAIEFDGLGQYRFHLPTNAFSGVTSAQIFVALQCNADVPSSAPNTGLWRFGTDSLASHYSYTDGVIYDDFGSSTRFTVGNPTPNLSLWHRLCVKAESSGYQLWINNTSVYSNATSCGSSWHSQPSFGGETVSFVDYRFKGYLLEIFCYTSVLSSTDRATADTYLADRISGAWAAAEAATGTRRSFIAGMIG